MRWRNPLAAVPLVLYHYTPVPSRCQLDGAVTERGRVDLAPGPHTVAVTIEDANPEAGLLLFAAVHNVGERQKTSPGEVEEEAVKLLSAADGTWKYSLEVPADESWTLNPFDDRRWASLVLHPTPKLDWDDFGGFACRRGSALGAVCLGLPPTSHTGTVRIRKSFTIPGPRLVS
jgi:hypothetical protein